MADSAPTTLESGKSSYPGGCVECGGDQGPEDSDVQPDAEVQSCIGCGKQCCARHWRGEGRCWECQSDLVNSTVTSDVRQLAPLALALHEGFQRANALGLCDLEDPSTAAARVQVSMFF